MVCLVLVELSGGIQLGGRRLLLQFICNSFVTAHGELLSSIIPLLECLRKEFWFIRRSVQLKRKKKTTPPPINVHARWQIIYILLGAGDIDEAKLMCIICIACSIQRKQTRILMYSKFLSVLCHPEYGVISMTPLLSLSLSHTHTQR